MYKVNDLIKFLLLKQNDLKTIKINKFSFVNILIFEY